MDILFLRLPLSLKAEGLHFVGREETEEGEEG